jgi:hypothetical protein
MILTRYVLRICNRKTGRIRVLQVAETAGRKDRILMQGLPGIRSRVKSGKRYRRMLLKWISRKDVVRVGGGFKWPKNCVQ